MAAGRPSFVGRWSKLSTQLDLIGSRRATGGEKARGGCLLEMVWLGGLGWST